MEAFIWATIFWRTIPQENTAKGEVNEEEEDYMKAKTVKRNHFDIVYHQ